MLPSRPTYGDHLWGLLPEVYRERDTIAAEPTRDGDLRKYLNAHGVLLDRLRNTLEQLYADHFPDVPAEGRVCQSWVIPYLADLVGATVVSPFANGHREEVANAVRWSKAKGTLKTTAEIAEAVTQTEAELQEGYARLIRSAVPGESILPADDCGEPDHPLDAIAASGDPSESWLTVNPQIAASHPGLPTATIDLRLASRAVLAPRGAGGSRESRFGLAARAWPADDNAPGAPKPEPLGFRQFNPNGAPCFPGSHEDASRRTADLRTPDATGRNGRYHPKRLLIYLPPPPGFFPLNPVIMAMPGTWDADDFSPNKALRKTVSQDGSITIENITSGAVHVSGAVEHADGATTRYGKIVFTGSVSIGKAHVAFNRCAIKALAFTAPAGTTSNDRSIEVVSCLLDDVTGGSGIARLEYCTILSSWTAAARPFASEAIFPEGFDGSGVICTRYSSLTEAAARASAIAKANTTARPAYLSSTFGEAGAGVLAQDSELALLQGAEDGGEIGAFHDWRFAAQREALKLKLADFLPMGMEPLVIWDGRLSCAPPALKPSVQP